MFDDGPKNKSFDSTTIRRSLETLDLARPIAVEAGSPVSTAIEQMQRNHVGCALIVRSGKLAGIFTERDLLMKQSGTSNRIGAAIVDDVMTPDPETLRSDDTIAFALHMMAVGGYRHVPVVDEEGKPIAVISVKDIIAFILEHFAQDVLNLPPTPVRKTSQREGA